MQVFSERAKRADRLWIGIRWHRNREFRGPNVDPRSVRAEDRLGIKRHPKDRGEAEVPR